MKLPEEWGTARVAEPIGITNNTNTNLGAFRVVADIPTILSVDPAQDFELNTDIIEGWKMIFMSPDADILGEADYLPALEALNPYIIDQQNGSLLIRALSIPEIDDVILAAGGTPQG